MKIFPALRNKIIIPIAVYALLVVVFVLLFSGKMDKVMYRERQQTLSLVTQAAAVDFKNEISSQWDIYNLSYSIASECVRESDDIRKCIFDINSRHDFDADYYFMVDEDGGYYCSDGVTGKLDDFSYYLSTSPDRVEYLSTLPHMNPRKAYMIYRGRFDRVERMNTEYGEKTIVFFAYAQDITELKNSIGSLFSGDSNVFIFDGSGVLLYEEYSMQALVEGHNIFRKLSQCDMPFNETEEDIELRCKKGELQVVKCDIKGSEYYFCSAPLGLYDWTLAFMVPPQDVDFDLSVGVGALVWYGVAILLLTCVLLLILAYFFRKYADEQRRKESQELITAIEETSRAKSVFLSNMSHDIRTPINAIMGVTAIARMAIDDPRKVSDNLSKIETASSHLLSLINDVLDMSRIESGKTTITLASGDVAGLCRDCADIVNGQIAERDLGFITEFDVSHPKVFVDEVHLRRILINILGNAIKFTRDGGRIIFRCYETACTEDSVTCRFEVRDNGIGMSKKFLDHIFEAFSQEQNRERTKYSGTGLGMAITKQLVELMGGTIEVESEINKGSSFYVTLTFKRDLEAAAEASANADADDVVDGPDTDIAGVRILLVEDNELNMEIAEALLTMNGAVVDKAWDGLDALDKFTSKDIGSYDVILMDIMMPRMDGFEAIKAIRALNREDAASIPIIAMTANAFEDDIKATREASFNDHLSKPIEIENVKKTIVRFVRK